MLAVAGRVTLTLLTMLYTILSVSSCALPAQPAELVQLDIPKEAPAGRTLTILQSQGDISGSLQQAVDLYLAGHPDVNIQVRTIADESSYKATLRSRLAAGEDAGLFHIFGYSDMLELKTHLDDLSDLGWAGDAIADTIEPVTLNGSVYGIPYSVDAVGILVNLDVFTAAEADIAGVTTYEELADAFRELRAKITLGELKEEFPNLEAVTALPAQDSSFLGCQLMEIALGDEFSSSAQVAGAGSIVFASDAAMGKYVDLLAQYSTNGRSWQSLLEVTRASQVEGGLATGRIACIQQNIRIYHRVKALDKELAARLRLLPIPLEDAEQSFIYTGAPAYWAVNAAASDDSKAIARDFLTWLYQSEDGGKVMASGFGAVSPYRAFASDTESALDRQMLGYIEQGRSLPRYGREFPGGWDAAAAETLRRYFGELDYSWEALCAKLREDWAERRQAW